MLSFWDCSRINDLFTKRVATVLESINGVVPFTFPRPVSPVVKSMLSFPVDGTSAYDATGVVLPKEFVDVFRGFEFDP
ncbi:hypothetical protein P5673_020653 [Acropora cervicornis]|uniref:Uncharacterized protein n=1 Tax=Acropora cervicornis TaxID=6130 RepID=A0AAD9Q9E0_ACRCE|nr:hypothetical protein P5673_020653 [Acropora cervicornis]